MSSLIKLFNEHPEEVGETYFEHMRMALKFSMNCAWASVALFIHSIFPFLFRTTGSSIITKLFQSMVRQRLEKRKQKDETCDDEEKSESDDEVESDVEGESDDDKDQESSSS